MRIFTLITDGPSVREIDPQARPAPDYEVDQRVACKSTATACRRRAGRRDRATRATRKNTPAPTHSRSAAGVKPCYAAAADIWCGLDFLSVISRDTEAPPSKDRSLSMLNDDSDPNVFDFAAHARRAAVIA